MVQSKVCLFAFPKKYLKLNLILLQVRLGFADTTYTEHVAENSPNSTLIRTLPIWNKSKHKKDTPLKCLLTESSKKGLCFN